MVVKGIAKPSILKTYETERRSVAQELIAGDQGLSRAWSSPPQKGAGDQNGAAMTEFGRVFKQLQISAMGFGVHYGPSILTAKDSKDTTGATWGDEGGESPSKVDLASSHQHLATKTALGERFPSFRVVHHCNARSWHLADWLKSDGIFHILLFAGNVSLPTQMDRVRRFACEMTAKTEFIPLRRRFPSIPDGCSNGVPSGNTDGIAQLLTIHSAPREQVEFHDFPSLLRPFDEEMGYDYDSIFVDDESYFEGHGHAYDGYGVDPTKGCVMTCSADRRPVVLEFRSTDFSGNERTLNQDFFDSGPRDSSKKATFDDIRRGSPGRLRLWRGKALRKIGPRVGRLALMMPTPGSMMDQMPASRAVPVRSDGQKNDHSNARICLVGLEDLHKGSGLDTCGR
ncbi:MAG: hypothetical protein LQ344_001973 [Seirophora lacunosa]|nr:MAG: hypothetical protein LQ344_001973 [Seirophora lacunosa]